jgi:hypothetical protein
MYFFSLQFDYKESCTFRKNLFFFDVVNSS